MCDFKWFRLLSVCHFQATLLPIQPIKKTPKNQKDTKTQPKNTTKLKFRQNQKPVVVKLVCCFFCFFFFLLVVLNIQQRHIVTILQLKNKNKNLDTTGIKDKQLSKAHFKGGGCR